MRETKIRALKFFCLFFIGFFILFLNFYPHLHAKINTPQNMEFLGQASWFDPWDINLYVSFINSGQENGFFASNSYTSLPNKPIFMYPLYTILGMIFKTADSFLIFHLAALFCGILIITVLFKLIKLFLNNFFEQIISLLVICLGGGLGFLFYPLIQSADLSMTAFAFLSAFQRPHEAIGLLAYLYSLVIFWQMTTTQSKNRKLLIFSVFIFLIMIIFYPYYLLSFVLIESIFIFLKDKKKIKISSYLSLLYFFIPGCFFVFLIAKQMLSNPTFESVLTQNLPTPNIFCLFSGYGFLALLFIYQLFFIRKNEKLLFLNIWIIVSLIMAFLPFGFSRFYLRGLFFPLTILSVVSLKTIAQKYSLNKVFLFSLFVFFSLLSSLRITMERVNAVSQKNIWYYISKNEFKSLQYLKNNSRSQAGVLALYNFGNIIPSYTKNSVYFGHFLQTPDALEKIKNLNAFYTNSLSQNEAKNFLQENNISYVFYGKGERNLNNNRGLNYSFLIPVFKNKDLIIFAIKN